MFRTLVDVASRRHKLLRLLFHPHTLRRLLIDLLLRGVLAHILGDLHRAKVRATFINPASVHASAHDAVVRVRLSTVSSIRDRLRVRIVLLPTTPLATHSLRTTPRV